VGRGKSVLRETEKKKKKVWRIGSVHFVPPLAIDSRMNPLELPEIAAILADFLGRLDLVRCMRVCRVWHLSFLPLVWRNVVISQGRPHPAMQVLGRHSQFVKELRYHVDLWHEYGPAHCPNALSLTVFSSRDLAPVDIELFEQQISHFMIHGMDHWVSLHSILQQPLPLPNLSKLELDFAVIESDHSTIFWNLCTRLDSLIIRAAAITEMPDRSLAFGRLKELTIAANPMIMLNQQLDFITQCPNLTYLHWKPWERISPDVVGRFASHLAGGGMPNLRTLHSTDLVASDVHLSKIISGIRQLWDLGTPGCEPGQLSFTALRSHFSWLRKLDIKGNPNHTLSFTGPMVQEILASCPLLETLLADQIASQDILDGQPWACDRSMKDLTLWFVITPGQDEDVDFHQRHVLERISQLSNLESLCLFSDNRSTDVINLDLRLEKGLGQLATLKRLKRVSFLDNTQNMSHADVEVMYPSRRSFFHCSSFCLCFSRMILCVCWGAHFLPPSMPLETTCTSNALLVDSKQLEAFEIFERDVASGERS